MYIFLIIVHVIASLLLIAAILLQAGRGGGLSEAFGGSSTQTIFGTSATTFLKKATTITAIVFLSTSLILAVYSSKMSKSIMGKARISPIEQDQIPIQTTAEEGTGDAAVGENEAEIEE